MSAVPGHFFERTLPVIEHAEYVPGRQVHGLIGFAELLRFPACGLHDADHDSAETSRDVTRTKEIENEIAVLLANQVFQLLLDRLAVTDRRDVVAELDDDYFPNLFEFKRDRLGQEFWHAEFGEKVDYPTDNEQFPDVENNANPGDGDHCGKNEAFQGKASQDAEKAKQQAQIVVSTNRK